MNKESPRKKQLANLLESYAEGKPSQIIEDSVKPKGFWNNPQNILKEARKVIKIYGDLPGGEKLKELGYGGLDTAILRHYGGMRKLRNELGIRERKKENGLWKDEKYIINYASHIIKKNNLESLPSSTTLNKMGEMSFVHAVHKYHGGFISLRNKLGEKLLRKRGMWNLKYTKQQALDFMREYKLDSLPSQQYLSLKGRSDLSTAIAVQGGFVRFRRLFGEKPVIRNPGSLKDRKYIVEEIKKLMRKHHLKTVPTTLQLGKLGESSLGQAIIRNHGGYTAFRRAMGEKNIKEASGQWQDIKFGVREARRIIKKHSLDYLPGNMELRKMGYNSLSSAITKYYGGYHKFRENLGENKRRIEDGKLAKREYILKELRRIIKEKKCIGMPTTTQLRDWGYASLAQSLFIHHGGINSVAKSLGKKQGRISMGSWESLDFTLVKAKEILAENKLNRLPCHENLIKYSGGPSLSRAIVKYCGGYTLFRPILEKYLGIKPQSSQLEEMLENYIREHENE